MQGSDYYGNQCSGYFCGVEEEDCESWQDTQDIQGGWQSSKRVFPYNNVMNYTFLFGFQYLSFVIFLKGKIKITLKPFGFSTKS